uniref:Aminotransferase-like plant mobile domain-containing protein n=1 Tax=Fagus sylvatica TaxID=28930 RepID=A0A2N9H6S8_FAGSY
MMDRCKKYCFTVPVLATIYKGLNEIASSSVPSKCDTTFSTHYLNAWLAEYFTTHFDWPRAGPTPRMVRFSGESAAKYFEEVKARKLFHSITDLEFHRLALSKKHQEILEDNDHLSDFYGDYFICQRFSYLSSRRGDLSVLKLNSPHRFGCQFGFNQDIPREIKEDLRTATLEKVVYLWHRCLRLITKLRFLVPSHFSSDAALCTKDYIDWWAKRSGGFFSSDPGQPNGNIGPRGTEETAGIVSTFRGTDKAMVSHASKLNEEKRISSSDHGKEVSGSDSDHHWRRKKYNDNVINDANHKIVIKTTEPLIDVDMSSPFPSGDEQVSLSSLFYSANTKSVKALCCLFNDLVVVYGIQELVEGENLDISLSQVDVDPLKEVDERQSPADGSRSMSEFSVQGLETFDLATKVIDKSCLEKHNASMPFSSLIRNPTKDMVSMVRSSGVPAISTISTLNVDDVILKSSRHYVFMLREGLIGKIIKTPFDSVAYLKEKVKKFMENASQYSSIRYVLTQRISLKVKNQRRADAERHHTLALK